MKRILNWQRAGLGWQKQFALLSVGQIFSIIGSAAAQFAIIWWLTIETGSAITLTMASLVGYLPQALLGPFIGAWVDRYDRKRIMMLADSFVALTSAVLAVAFLLDAVTLPVIYIVLFLRALGNAFHGTAYQTVIPAFVPQDALTKAGAWGEMVRSGASMLGPVIGAFLMGVATLPAIMLVDIVGAVLAVGSLVFIHVPQLPPAEQKGSVLADVRDGFRVLAGNRQLMSMLLAVLVVVFMANPVFSLLSLMVTEHYSGGVWHNSAVQLCTSIGLLLGAAVLGVWGGGKRQFPLMSGAILISGLCAMGSGLLPGTLFVPFAAFMFITGLVNSAVNVPYTAYIQKAIEPQMLGKVMGTISMVNSIAAPLGLILAGPMAERLGVARWFVIAGAVIVADGIYMLLKSRAFDSQPAPAAQVAQGPAAGG